MTALGSLSLLRCTQIYGTSLDATRARLSKRMVQMRLLGLQPEPMYDAVRSWVVLHCVFDHHAPRALNGTGHHGFICHVHLHTYLGSQS